MPFYNFLDKTNKSLSTEKRISGWLGAESRIDKKEGMKKHKKNWGNNEYVSMLIVIISQVYIKIKPY